MDNSGVLKLEAQHDVMMFDGSGDDASPDDKAAMLQSSTGKQKHSREKAPSKSEKNAEDDSKSVTKKVHDCMVYVGRTFERGAISLDMSESILANGFTIAASVD